MSGHYVHPSPSIVRFDARSLHAAFYESVRVPWASFAKSRLTPVRMTAAE